MRFLAISNYSATAILSLVLVLACSKSKKSDPTPGPEAEPTVVTTSVSNIGFRSAQTGGTIQIAGNTSVTERGVCYDTVSNPNVSKSKTSDGSGSGTFVSTLNSLIPGKKYFTKAYAKYSGGVVYGNEISFETDPQEVKDMDGNKYPVVRIGSQLWLKKNLKTSRYRNGDRIPKVSIGFDYNDENNVTGSYIYCNQDSSNNETYGKLYNFFTTVDPRGLCPAGWHVPTKSEWDVLINHLGGINEAGLKLPDSTGFSMLYGGRFMNVDNSNGGSFVSPGEMASFWSTTYSTNSAPYNEPYNFQPSPGSGFIGWLDFWSPRSCFSIRCIKDR